jgi:hypothetical protein
MNRSYWEREVQRRCADEERLESNRGLTGGGTPTLLTICTWTVMPRRCHGLGGMDMYPEKGVLIKDATFQQWPFGQS